MKDKLIEFVSIQLDKDLKEPLYVQLYEQIKLMIKQHLLSPGYKLPAVRNLAQNLQVNPSTVVNAYKELEKNGFIFSKRGSGSYVAEQVINTIDELEENNHIPIDLTDDLKILQGQKNVINMSTISLNPDMISIESFKQVVNKILERDKGYAFTYQDSQGYLPLRQSITQELAKKRINTTPEYIQIISGAQQGIDIVARAILKHGDIVFVENPTYPGAIAAFRSCGAKIIDIKLTKEGIDLVDLENKLRKFRPKLIYVMPNIQNPTGISYTKANCRRLMGLARFYNAYILEDDYISGLCYQEKSPIPLKAYDTDDRVIYIRSLSKIFMPGLRLAYLIMPQVLAQTLLNVKHISDIATSGLTQRVFDYYLREGLWQEHLNSIRSVYKTQFEFALRMAKKYLPKDIDYLKPQGGLSLWLNLPDRLNASEIIEKARNEGVIICDGAPFFVRNAPNKQIRLSFATLSLAEINTGIKIIQNITKY
jgi:DNA-binding transcriptional MocR family regulator